MELWAVWPPSSILKTTNPSMSSELCCCYFLGPEYASLGDSTSSLKSQAHERLSQAAVSKRLPPSPPARFPLCLFPVYHSSLTATTRLFVFYCLFPMRPGAVSALFSVTTPLLRTCWTLLSIYCGHALESEEEDGGWDRLLVQREELISLGDQMDFMNNERILGPCQGW